MIKLDKRYTFRMTEREYSILEGIGNRYGLGVSDILRRIIYEYTESKGIVIYDWEYKKQQIEKIFFLLDDLHKISNSLKKHSIYATEQMQKIKKYKNNVVFTLEKKILKFRIRMSRKLIENIDILIGEIQKYVRIMNKKNGRKNRNIL